MLLCALKTHPRNVVGIKAVQQSNTRKHFETIELNKVKYLSVENLSVFSLKEPPRKDMCYKFRQKICHLSVGALC